MTCTEHSEEGGWGGDSQSMLSQGSLLPFPHLPALARRSSSLNQLSLQAGARVRLKLIWAWSGPSAKISLPHLPSKGIYLLQGDFHAQRNCSEVTLILKLIFDFTE